MILQSHTVIDPWAVMVEALDAVAAHGAVPASACSYCHAVWA